MSLKQKIEASVKQVLETNTVSKAKRNFACPLGSEGNGNYFFCGGSFTFADPHRTLFWWPLILVE